MKKILLRSAMVAPLLLAGACVSTAEKTHPPGADPVATSSIAPKKLQAGYASYYRHGRRTANGESFDPEGMTAAHRTLPFGTKVRVVHPGTGREVVVRINDRGPFTGGRVIDLAQGAARHLGLLRSGVARVEIYAMNENASK